MVAFFVMHSSTSTATSTSSLRMPAALTFSARAPWVNLHDKLGNQYLCEINVLRDPKQPHKQACVKLEGMSTKGDMS
jgi:hypothetical protein